MVRRRKANPFVFLLAAIVVIAVGWWQQRADDAKPVPTAPESTAATKASPPQPSVPAPSAPAASRALDRIPDVERTSILAALALIDRGGPFPHRQDGSVFQNRERRLPQKPRGYYREYTVATPGASNRGARRLVIGRDGDTWYTSDHYNTFVRIDE